jgi:hypothetical protein
MSLEVLFLVSEHVFEDLECFAGSAVCDVVLVLQQADQDGDPATSSVFFAAFNRDFRLVLSPDDVTGDPGDLEEATCVMHNGHDVTAHLVQANVCLGSQGMV